MSNTAQKTPAIQPATRHHLDRFADDLVVFVGDGDPDELLGTAQVARLMHVSTQWLEIGRVRGYGPSYIKLGPRMVRYGAATS